MRRNFAGSFFAGCLIAVAVLISGCGDGPHSPGSADSPKGALAVRLHFDDSGRSGFNQTARAAADICSSHGIETIELVVYRSDILLASASWPCAAHGGVLDNVPAESNLKAECRGMVQGSAQWYGVIENLTVEEGRDTHIDISLQFVGDPSAQLKVQSIAPPSITAPAPANT